MNRTMAAMVVGLAGGVAGGLLVRPGADADATYSRNMVEIDSPELAMAMTEAGAESIECNRGVISNHPDRVYCTDHGTAGFLLATNLEALLSDGNRFMREANTVYQERP